MNRSTSIPVPYFALGLLLATWITLGIWICFTAPYASGTDESIRYVAFAAAKNRWATTGDAAVYGIEHAYYPPLYFLLFAPFYGDQPSFSDRYPAWSANLAMRLSGSTRLASSEDLARVPPELWRLYRTAKVVSLLFGLGVVACLIFTVRLVFTGETRHWLVLGTVGPLLLLPQFLYYQTLVNNDCLVNFLSALALFCFVAAARRTGEGDFPGARRLGGFCAAAIGLGLLTKQSAASLLPLLPALAWLHGNAPPPSHSGAWVARGGGRRRERVTAALRHLALLSAICLAAGGWWLLRPVLSANPDGFSTHKNLHDWAIRGEGVAALELLPAVVSGAARSFIAMFAGVSFGIPDRIYAAYLFIAAALAALVLMRAVGRRGRPAQPTLTLPVWLGLGAAIALNGALFLAYNVEFLAPYGRLLFPTLIASALCFGWILRAISGDDRRRLAPLVVTLVLLLGGLFGWVFANRMVPAVVQPAEKLVPLGVPGTGRDGSLGPVWASTVEQPALLPPGRLTGFRVWIESSSYLPQFGTVIHASLTGLAAAPGVPGRRFKPQPFGESDGIGRWTELELENPVDLSNMTTVRLRLRADPPWFITSGNDIFYNTTSLERSPLLQPMTVSGKTTASGLVMTAVYDPRR